MLSLRKQVIGVTDGRWEWNIVRRTPSTDQISGIGMLRKSCRALTKTVAYALPGFSCEHMFLIRRVFILSRGQQASHRSEEALTMSEGRRTVFRSAHAPGPNTLRLFNLLRLFGFVFKLHRATAFIESDGLALIASISGTFLAEQSTEQALWNLSESKEEHSGSVVSCTIGFGGVDWELIRVAMV